MAQAPLGNLSDFGDGNAGWCGHGIPSNGSQNLEETNEGLYSSKEVSSMNVDIRHQCTIYQSEEQRSTSLRAFLVQALMQQEKLIVIADPINCRANFVHLERVGIDLQPCVAQGQLRVLTVHQTFLRQGGFDPSRMIAWLQNETRRARSEGYRALRFAAEMTWVLLAAAGSERLIDYEGELNEVLRGDDCQVLCQYDGRRFSPAVLQQVLAVHPTVIVGAAVCHNSYYQIAPSSFGEGPASATLGHWLADLTVHGQAMVQ